MGAKAPRKYCGKTGLLRGYQYDSEKERQLADIRLENKEKIRLREALRALRAQGFVFDKFKQHLRNLTGRKTRD